MIKAIYPALLSYWDCGSKIELHYPGSVITYSDPEDMAKLRKWSAEAFSLYIRNQKHFNLHDIYQEGVRLGYIEYMTRFGQFEE